jgi:hypothetical protein
VRFRGGDDAALRQEVESLLATASALWRVDQDDIGVLGYAVEKDLFAVGRNVEVPHIESRL